jgi:hypothetical protein
LYKELSKILETKQPKYFIAEENVKRFNDITKRERKSLKGG